MPIGSNTSVRKFNALESWRGIACLLVLVYHCGVNLRNPPFALFGFVGVHMFFVLSGYLLFRPYASAMFSARELPDTRNFYLRRLIRILPPYLVSLCCFVLIRHVSGTKPPSTWNVLSHALLIFNYFPNIDFFSINLVYWSLAIEMQFYLLLPIVCLCFASSLKKENGRLAASLSVLVMLAAGLCSRWAEIRFLSHHYEMAMNQDHVAFRSLGSYLDMFAIGMGAALLQLLLDRQKWLGLAGLRMGLIFLGVTGFFAANDWCAIAGAGWQSPSSITFGLLFPVLICTSLGLLLLMIVTAPNGGSAWLGVKPLRWLGEISYSLYLYHAGVEFFIFKLHLFHTWSYNAMTVGNALVALPPCIAVASVMYFLVEKPSLKLVAKIRDRASKPRDSASVSYSTDPATPANQPVSLLAP